jgi:hypothetical protein
LAAALETTTGTPSPRMGHQDVHNTVLFAPHAKEHVDADVGVFSVPCEREEKDTKVPFDVTYLLSAVTAPMSVLERLPSLRERHGKGQSGKSSLRIEDDCPLLKGTHERSLGHVKEVFVLYVVASELILGKGNER